MVVEAFGLALFVGLSLLLLLLLFFTVSLELSHLFLRLGRTLVSVSVYRGFLGLLSLFLLLGGGTDVTADSLESLKFSYSYVDVSLGGLVFLHLDEEGLLGLEGGLLLGGACELLFNHCFCRVRTKISWEGDCLTRFFCLKL